jgi:plastocyanin
MGPDTLHLKTTIHDETREVFMRWKLQLAIAIATLAASVVGAQAATINIIIKGLKFTPAAVTAHVGDTIVWTNQDPMPHTATARSKDWDLSIPPGQSASFVVAKAGVFDYFCRIHASMSGKLTVN